MTLINFAQLQSLMAGRSRSSIYRDLNAGRLPRPMRFGSRLYWDKAQVLQKLHDFLQEECGP
ncbi:AlpA family phage regulatory protein [Rhodobacterales bacterium HKCCA1288]|nr:AlpA family phage regulatory protein [Rhodobacterales bacterium HKCCA1288]